MQRLQLLLYKFWPAEEHPDLAELALANCGTVQKRDRLAEATAKLTLPQLQLLVCQQLRYEDCLYCVSHHRRSGKGLQMYEQMLRESASIYCLLFLQIHSMGCKPSNQTTRSLLLLLLCICSVVSKCMSGVSVGWVPLGPLPSAIPHHSCLSRIKLLRIIDRCQCLQQ